MTDQLTQQRRDELSRYSDGELQRELSRRRSDCAKAEHREKIENIWKDCKAADILARGLKWVVSPHCVLRYVQRHYELSPTNIRPWQVVSNIRLHLEEAVEVDNPGVVDIEVYFEDDAQYFYDSGWLLVVKGRVVKTMYPKKKMPPQVIPHW